MFRKATAVPISNIRFINENDEFGSKPNAKSDADAANIGVL